MQIMFSYMIFLISKHGKTQYIQPSWTSWAGQKSSSAAWCWPCPQPPSLDAVDDSEEFIATRPGEYDVSTQRREKKTWVDSYNPIP